MFGSGAGLAPVSELVQALMAAGKAVRRRSRVEHAEIVHLRITRKQLSGLQRVSVGGRHPGVSDAYFVTWPFLLTVADLLLVRGFAR
ncbi:hypothetical protein ACWGQ4_02330 [Streptomyces sp. NPDC055721]|uniref:hypothetical protein n=1 Tax=Streptomyces sp. NPDC127132 TaxID=3345374 RepID=UPI00363C72F2